MAESQAISFDRCAAFTRGYLLACDWAGSAPVDAEGKIPRLANEGVHDLYLRFRQLPRATREALRASWPKREPRCRLDESGVHPSWLTELLQSEPAATLLLALGELKPEVGREVLRSFWPRVKPSQGDPLEVRPLAPAWSGELRRWLFRRFAHAAPSALREDSAERSAFLDAQQLWLLAQDLGREELAKARAAEQNRREPPGDHSAESRAASARVESVLDLDEGDPNYLGAIGLHTLATQLAEHPREYAERIAHQMDVSLAERFLARRDEVALQHRNGER